MVLLIDNYDSFSYNLFQLIGTINPDIKVIRNNMISVSEIYKLKPSHIVLSPGPGYPKDAGICIDTARELGADIPVLGVCLGHQAICEAFGSTITYALKLMHGKQSRALIDTSCPLFAGMPEQITVARYHSLAAVRDTIPDCLRVTAETDDGEVMAVMHRQYPIFGVQFHPESILTPEGLKVIENFLSFNRRAEND